MSHASVSSTTHFDRRGPARVPPGPRWYAEIPRSPAADPVFFSNLLKGREEFGEVLRVGFPGMRRFVAYHPDDVQRVLLDNYTNYSKECFEYSSVRLLIGRGLVTSDGELWRRQRKLAAPSFTPRAIAPFAQDMITCTEEMLDRWEPSTEADSPIDLGPEMMALALRIAGRAFFGFDTERDGAEVGQALSTALLYLTERMVPLPLWVPLPSTVRFRRARRLLFALVDRMIEARRRDPGPDLLSSLIRARDEDSGEAMSNELLRDEVLTLVVASHETTAMTLSWCAYLLSTHPEVRCRLQSEADSVLGDRMPTLEDVPQLSYTRLVIDETLRLYPPVWGIARVAREPDQVGGYRVPAGGVIILSPYATHRHPDFWENPMGFEPERFAPERARERHRFAYFPFAGGGRICIGNNFALMEAVLVLARMTQRFELDLMPSRPVVPQALLTIRARDGMWMKVRRRTPSA